MEPFHWYAWCYKSARNSRLKIPIKKYHPVQHPPWFTSEIRHCIKRLRTSRRKYKLRPSQNILTNIVSLEATVQEKIRMAKLDYESSLINNFTPTNSNKSINI